MSWTGRIVCATHPLRTGGGQVASIVIMVSTLSVLCAWRRVIQAVNKGLRELVKPGISGMTRARAGA